MREDSRDQPARTTEVLVVLGSLAFLLVLVLGRGEVLLYGDEHLSIPNLGASWSETFALYDARGTGVGFLVLQKLAVGLFGAGLLAYRLPALLGAVLAVLAMLPVGRRLVGGRAALAATPLLASTSLFLHYAGFARAYALLAGLALLYVGALAELLACERVRRRDLLLATLAGGLLPWFHLTALAPVLLVGASAVLLALARGERARAGRLSGVLGAALLVALLLFLPARESMLAFAEEKVGGKGISFGPLAVAALVPGTWTAGLVWSALLPLAALGALARRRGDGLLVVVAVLAPVVGLLVARPSGGVYAWARYLILALPFAAMLLAWLLDACLELSSAARGHRGLPTLLAGLAAAAVLFATGPRVRDPAAGGPFANANTGLLALPAFDVPFPGRPAFYDRLAASPDPLVIVEIPEQVSRSILLYRSYWLTHRKDVRLGYVLHKTEREIPAGPYLAIDPENLAAVDADYVVLHKAIDRELQAYWLFVHGETWKRLEDPRLLPHMKGHGSFGKRFLDRKPRIAGLAELGRPVFEDEFLMVWRLPQAKAELPPASEQ